MLQSGLTPRKMAKSNTNKKNRKDIFQRARHLAVQRDPERGISLIDEYLSKFDSQDVDFLLLKGSIFEMTGRIDQASKIYKTVLHIDPRNTQALIDLGDSSSSKNEYRRAISFYDRALKHLEKEIYYRDLADEFVQACVNKADAFLELKKPGAACQCIVNGLQKYPTDDFLLDGLQRAQANYHASKDKMSRSTHGTKVGKSKKRRKEGRNLQGRRTRS